LRVTSRRSISNSTFSFIGESGPARGGERTD
jgi:hypothetical protein